MKNILNALAVSFALIGNPHATKAQQNTVTIEGTLKLDKLKPLKLFKVDEGELKEIANCQPDAQGQFGFHVYPEYEGFYVLGTGEGASAVDNYLFWFKKGDKLRVALSKDRYELIQGSEENNLLAQWYQIKYPIEQKSIYFMRSNSNYTDFFPVLETTLPTVKDWASKVKSSNKKFQIALQKLVPFEMAFYAINFLQTPRTKHPNAEELPAYYKNLNFTEMMDQTDDIYFYPWGKRALSFYVLRENIRQAKKLTGGIEGLRTSLSFIPNDTLKGDYVLQHAAKLRDYASYLDVKAAVGQYVITDKQQALEFEIQKPLATLKPGDKGLDFTFEDNKGKQVSFADFKGKILLVDLWATWCGPCKAEFPYLRQLKKDLEGTDVVVMGISVDAEKDKAKWKQMIIDEQLSGVQLLAGPGNKVSQYYKVTGIPRFMIFDKEGKIVTIDAPRPSNPALKELLMKLHSGN